MSVPSCQNVLTTQKGTSREWWGLAILALPCLLYSMDLTVLNLAVPHITADLRPSGMQMLWIVDIYGFVLACALITMGAIGDRIGRRLLLLVGASAFGLASILAAFAPSAEILIAARALLGLAAATMAPSTLSLIRTIFQDSRDRAFAIGVWMASFSVGGAIGPLVGGVLLEHFWWGSVFLIAVPVVVLLLAVGPLVLPEYKEFSAGNVDVTSAGVSILVLLAIVYGIKHIAVGHFTMLSGASLVLGLAMGWVFFRRQRFVARPMIDVAIFGAPHFAIALAINFAAFFLAFGTLLLLAQHLQLVVGMGSMEAGLWTLFSAAGFVGGSFLAPMMMRLLPSASIMSLSLLTAAIGLGLLVLALGRETFPLLVLAIFLFSIGLSPVFTLATELIVGAAPEAQAGSAAALAETRSELGGAMGIAVLGSVVIAFYRDFVDTLLPADLPSEVQDAVYESIVAAADVSNSLPISEAVPVLDAAQQAFTSAFMAASAIGVFIAAISAALALALRKISAEHHASTVRDKEIVYRRMSPDSTALFSFDNLASAVFRSRTHRHIRPDSNG